jgi:hypothetical protein
MSAGCRSRCCVALYDRQAQERLGLLHSASPISAHYAVPLMDLRIPPIRYADNDGIEIAYQVIGDSGPVFMGIPGLAQNIELMWEEPRAARFLRRLGSFSRLIHFDKRGTGLSGRGSGLSSFPDRVTDLQAVMEAEGVDDAFIGGFSEGGSMSALFAASSGFAFEDLGLSTLKGVDGEWRVHLLAG